MNEQNTQGTGNGYTNPVEGTGLPTPHDKLPAILAYLGPLVIVSYLMMGDDPFLKFHTKQGLVLLVIEIILSVLSSVVFAFPFIWVLHVGILVLSLVGIVNVLKGEEKMLPLVGTYSRYFKF